MHRIVPTQAQNALLRPGPDPTYADGDDATWMSVDWPAMTRRVPVLGSAMNVVDTGGDGPAILWIHGLGGCWQNWLLSIPAFMGDHRCVAMDLPGFGESDLPLDQISIQSYARAVDALCRELDLERVTVVGNSMGGFVGAEIALAFATRVERLVLVSAAGLSVEYQRREPLLTAARVLTLGTSRAAAYHRQVVARRRLRRLAMQTVVRYPERLSHALAYEQLRGAGKPGFVPALEALMSYSFRERLAEIEVPVLVVWGENDMMVPVDDAQLFVDLIGDNARRIVFEDTGHAPMLERPSRFNALLGEFLAGEPAPESAVAGVHA
jgi:pimeloyl-ACP methyl ester carboxylesterase